MTESEAIKILQRDLQIQLENKALPDGIEAIQIAIQALEKQIPKKPDCIENKIWCCPVCDNNLLHKWIKYPTMLMPKSEGLPHCMSCGQKIDWSDDNDD